MRFNRDRRGYETTALVHTPRRKGRGQARILYWFRTPPGVRVGRAAIDEDAIRQLEQHNPDVQFDWTRILKQPVSTGGRPPDADMPGRKHDSGEREKSIRRESSPRPHPVKERSPAEVDVNIPAGEPAVEDEGTLSEASPEELGETPADEARQPAVQARLGAEGLARLRARYAEVMARIADRVTDDQVREELKARAERLNPDAWVTDEEVQQGLEQYESVFESLRSVVGHSRRRRRRRM